MIEPSQINPILVVLSEQLGNPLYFSHLLAYEGFFIEEISLKDLETRKEWYNCIFLIGEFQISNELKKRFEEFLKRGNILIGNGQIKGLENIFGISIRSAKTFPFPIGGIKNLSVGEGYLLYEKSPICKKMNKRYFPLHGFGCLPIKLTEAKILGIYQTTTSSVPNEFPEGPIQSSDLEEDFWPAISMNKIGLGVALFIAIDIVTTIRHVQEGRYIVKDGIPPADGMSPIDDGILKCEDGCVLDWNKDRRIISESMQIPAFMIPVADVWRKIITYAIEYGLDATQNTLEKMDYWPNAAPFIMMISHDTDGNNEKLAEGFLSEINSLGIRTTWCLIPPGYSPQLCQKIANAGHELAFHFDDMSYQFKDSFSLQNFKDQIEETLEHTGLPNFYSNKNHYTRWEGSVQFFEWCAQLGIKVDQSKGPSKCGNQGFPFGTAHPWFPMDKYGKIIDCLEIGFESQDLGLQGPNDTGPDHLKACQEIAGVCHFIFHPAHFTNKQVQKALKELVEDAKKMNAIFMKSIDIGEWVRSKLQIARNKQIHSLPHLVLNRWNPKNKKWERIN